MQKQTVGFGYGVLCDALEDQAKQQGFTLGKNADKLEQCRQAAITLRFGVDLPDSIYDKILQRIQKSVVKALKATPQKNKVEKSNITQHCLTGSFHSAQTAKAASVKQTRYR